MELLEDPSWRFKHVDPDTHPDTHEIVYVVQIYMTFLVCSVHL